MKALAGHRTRTFNEVSPCVAAPRSRYVLALDHVPLLCVFVCGLIRLVTVVVVVTAPSVSDPELADRIMLYSRFCLGPLDDSDHEWAMPVSPMGLATICL